MTVSRNVAELSFAGVAAGVPIACLMKAPSDAPITVYYGKARGTAVGTDFTLTLNPNNNDYEDFIITPNASLIAKINALIAAAPGVESNIIYVSRTYPLTTAFSESQSFSRDSLMREFDRVAMKFQQFARDLLRYSAPTDQITAALAVVLNAVATTAADAAAAAASAAAAAASAAAAAASAAVVSAPTLQDILAGRVLTAGSPSSVWAGKGNERNLTVPAWVLTVPAPCQNDVYPVACWGYGLGRSRMSKTPAEAFRDHMAKLGIPYNTTYDVVSPQGDDTTGLGTFAAPFKTFAKAFQTTTHSTTVLLPGEYQAADLIGATHAGAAVAKRVIAPYGRVTIGNYGTAYPDANTLTFTQLAVPNANVWSVTIGALVGSSTVVRVIDRLSRDEHGNFREMPFFTTTAALQAANYGWTFAAGTLGIAYVSANVNTLAAQNRFELIYSNSIGENVMYIKNAYVFFDGEGRDNITFKGLSLWMGKVGGSTGNLYLDGCKIMYAGANSLVHEGGFFYAYKTRSHSPFADHFNYNTLGGSGGVIVGMGVEWDVITTHAGGKETRLPPNANNNGSSSHGGSHVIRLGGYHHDAYGPVVADALDTSGLIDSFSHNVGVAVGRSDCGAQQFYMTGTRRIATFDGCFTETGGGPKSLDSDLGATVYTTNNNFTNPVTTETGGTITAYNRDAPPV